MSKAIEINEDGYLEFKIDGVEVQGVDVVGAVSALGKLGSRLSEDKQLDMLEYFNQCKDLLINLGFPPTMSLLTVREVMRTLREEEKRISKKFETTAD